MSAVLSIHAWALIFSLIYRENTPIHVLVYTMLQTALREYGGNTRVAQKYLKIEMYKIHTIVYNEIFYYRFRWITR